MERKIDTIIIHCSATKDGVPFHASDIDLWHKQRGFKCIGYHYVVTIDGCVEKGREENETGAHCAQQRMNHRSIGICYIGGLDRNGNPSDTRNDAQKKALLRLVKSLRSRYPGARVRGHRDFAPKACPCFDASTEYSSV